MAFWRWALRGAALAAAGLALVTVATALRGAWDHRDFPEALLVKALAWPTLFPIHMATGGLSLLLVPAAISASGSRWHRILGPLAAVDVAVAGVTALPVALESPITRWAAAGFTIQALVWLALLALGLIAIRAGDSRAHRRWMLLMAAVTSGAMFFRVYLALWIACRGYAHFKTFYSCDAFAAWMTPLAAMALWLKRRDPSSALYGK